MNRIFRASVASLLITTTSFWSVAAAAAPIAPEAALAGAAAVSEERAQVLTWMQRDDVRQQMTRLGVSPEQAADRVAALSDDEIHGLAGKLDQARVAGNGVIGAIVFVFLVLLVTDILGFTKVFPFTRSIR